MKIVLEHQEAYSQFCAQRLQNPYPLFHELREKEPVHWCGPLNTWLAFRYSDAMASLKDPRFLAGRAGIYDRVLAGPNQAKARAIVGHLSTWMQSINPPHHNRLRRLAGIAFTPRVIKEMIPRIRQIAQSRLESIRVKGEVDFIDAFCYWLPATVICDMLGLPQDDHAHLRRWVADLMPFSSGAGPTLEAALDPAHEALQGLLRYFGPSSMSGADAHPMTC